MLHSTPARDTAFGRRLPQTRSPVFLINGPSTTGHLTLQALREKVGDAVSFRILRDWAAQHRYGNVTTAQFITLAKRDSGRNLQYLFDVWLYQPDKPTSW